MSISDKDRRTYKQAVRGLAQLAPQATGTEILALLSPIAPISCGYIETYDASRPMDGHVYALNMPEPLLATIMHRTPEDADQVLRFVNATPVGRLLIDEDTLSEREWEEVEGYQALKRFGVGRASALKLASSPSPYGVEHSYLSLFADSGAPVPSRIQRQMLEALALSLRETFARLAVPLLRRGQVLAQVIEEQRFGAVLVRASGSVREANGLAYSLLHRYAAPLGTFERRGIRESVERLLGLPPSDQDGKRRVRHPEEASYLEARLHRLDPLTYDLPEPCGLLLLQEIRRPDEILLALSPAVAALSPRERELAVRLTNGGESLKQIAAAFRTSLHTVRRQSEAINKKLGVHSRAELARALRGKLGRCAHRA